MLVRRGDQGNATCIRLASLTLPVGMMPVLPPLQESVELASGDWLLIYSDGVSEAAAEGGEDFGDNRLLDSLGRLGTGTAAEVCEGVVDEVRNHLREQRQPDDITLIALRVL